MTDNLLQLISNYAFYRSLEYKYFISLIFIIRFDKVNVNKKIKLRIIENVPIEGR